MNQPKPYIPRPWQLPHLLATPIGGTVLIVERCERLVEEDSDWIWLLQSDGSKTGQHKDDSASISRLAKRYCPLGPIGTVLSIEGVGDLRTTAIDLRQVDSMTAREANRWGVTAVLDRDGTDADRLIAVVKEQEAAKERYLADDTGARWGDWAWFITAERIERC